MNDQISSAHMIQESSTYFTTDRFGSPKSALALNKDWTTIKSGYYFDTPEFTISVWVYPQSLGYWARVIDFHADYFGNREEIILSLDSGYNLKPTFSISSKASGKVLSSKPLVEGQWQFLTATFNGSLMCIYIDGTLMGDELLKNQMPAIIRPYNYIGDALNTYRYGESQSYLDELKFFNKSLSINEIKQLMNSSGSLILKL